MKKKTTQKSNGNVFKEIIRVVVREEVQKGIQAAEKRLKNTFHGELESVKDTFHGELKSVKNSFREEIISLKDTFHEELDSTFLKYRDDVLTKMDKFIGEIKSKREEDTIHQGQHADISDRLDNLETIHPAGQH